MENKTDTYIPYGDEWVKEIKKLPKEYIIGMLKDALTKQPDHSPSQQGGATVEEILNNNKPYGRNWEDFLLPDQMLFLHKAMEQYRNCSQKRSADAKLSEKQKGIIADIEVPAGVGKLKKLCTGLKLICRLDAHQCQQECENKEDRSKCPFVTSDTIETAEDAFRCYKPTLEQQADLVNDKRDYIIELDLPDIEEWQVDAMMDQELDAIINKHYPGGVAEFIKIKNGEE